MSVIIINNFYLLSKIDRDHNSFSDNFEQQYNNLTVDIDFFNVGLFLIFSIYTFRF